MGPIVQHGSQAVGPAAMINGVDALETVLAALNPRLDSTTYVFAVVAGGLSVPSETVALIEEMEGRTIVVPEQVAVQKGLLRSGPMRRITLEVQTPLDMVGLTACVSTALAQHGISANIVAGFYHDHVFVVAQDADKAMRLLRDLQSRATAE